MDWPSLTRILSTPCSFHLHILFIFFLCYLFLESRWDGVIKVSGKLCFRIRSFNVRMHTHTSIHLIPIYIQQDATLHSLFYLETALHISGGTTTHQQERKQLYLQHLVFVTPLVLPLL